MLADHKYLQQGRSCSDRCSQLLESSVIGGYISPCRENIRKLLNMYAMRIMILVYHLVRIWMCLSISASAFFTTALPCTSNFMDWR